MTTKQIHNLQRECREHELQHKKKQIEYETKQKILSSGIDIITQQMSFNTMALLRGLY